jgi:hypothetical protein
MMRRGPTQPGSQVADRSIDAAAYGSPARFCDKKKRTAECQHEKLSC